MSAINTFGLENIERRINRFNPKMQETFVYKTKEAIEHSFRSNPCRRTGDEEKRRLNLCVGLVMQAIEKEVPLQQVLETLPNCLNILIEHGELELDENGTMWQVHGSGITTQVSKEVITKSSDVNEEEMSMSDEDLDELLERKKHEQHK